MVSNSWSVKVLTQSVMIAQVQSQAILVPSSPPVGASAPVPEAFVSLSIEFGSFPTYAGNKTAPNQYTGNLLDNIASYQGTRPYIRVGGTTQDMALLNGYVTTPFNYTQLRSPSRDPSVIEYGGAFFDSYAALAKGGSKFIHGFNLAKSDGGFRRNLEGSMVVACKALEDTKSFLAWELGNEPDLYALAGPNVKLNIGGIKVGGLGAVREAASWNQKAFVNEWINVTRDLRSQMTYACPQLITPQAYKYVAPGFASTNEGEGWDVSTAYPGMNGDGFVGQVASHSAMSALPDIITSSLLLNHSHTIASSASILSLARRNAKLPVVITQSTSISPQGVSGISDTFASALWTLDHHLLLASNNVSRIHTHAGVDDPSTPWQPMTTSSTQTGTKPAYYGMIAAAAMLGDISSASKAKVQMANLMATDLESVYAAYQGGILQRVMIVNLRPWNASNPGQAQSSPAPAHTHLGRRQPATSTTDASSATSSPTTGGSEGRPHRPSHRPTATPAGSAKFRLLKGRSNESSTAGGKRTVTYSLQVPASCAGKSFQVSRLSASGSDATQNVTWDGYSYPVSSLGKPVRADIVPEVVTIGNGGTMNIKVPFAEAAMVTLNC